MKKKILVIGSFNTDMVIKVKDFPLPGETLLGEKFMMNPGGKGANQAVAAARLGGDVTFVTKIGCDSFGEQAKGKFIEEGIQTDHIFTDPDNPSGIALITVDSKGENNIVVASGANGTLSVADLKKIPVAFEQCEVVLLQLEIPLDTICYAVDAAFRYGKRVILNPAPASTLPDSLLNNLFMITPNKSEAEILSGIRIEDISSVQIAARVLKEKGVQHVIITLGDNGAYILNDNIARHIPSITVQAIDTTAAGDVFNGALAVAIAEGKSLESAIEFANHAAALSVTRVGAQTSAPYRSEIVRILRWKE